MMATRTMKIFNCKELIARSTNSFKFQRCFALHLIPFLFYTVLSGPELQLVFFACFQVQFIKLQLHQNIEKTLQVLLLL